MSNAIWPILQNNISYNASQSIDTQIDNVIWFKIENYVWNILYTQINDNVESCVYFGFKEICDE